MSGRSPDEVSWRLALLLAGTLLATACQSGPGPTETRYQPGDVYSLVLARSGGGPLDLSEFKGQVLVLDLFTTWSQTSMLAIPRYKVLQGRYGNQGLAVVGLALDELGDSVVGPFVQGMQIPYPVGLASEAIREGRSILGPISAIPMLLIFDRSGELIQVLLGLIPTEDVEKVLRRLL